MKLFMITMPLLGLGGRPGEDRRTMLDIAEVIRWLVGRCSEEAEKVVLVMDNLNTPSGQPVRGIPPERARGSREVGDPLYAQDGSWLNMAESRVSVLARQCWPNGSRPRRTWSAHVAVWEEEAEERGDPDQVAVHHGGCPDQALRLYPTL